MQIPFTHLLGSRIFWPIFTCNTATESYGHLDHTFLLIFKDLKIWKPLKGGFANFEVYLSRVPRPRGTHNPPKKNSGHSHRLFLLLAVFFATNFTKSLSLFLHTEAIRLRVIISGRERLDQFGWNFVVSSVLLHFGETEWSCKSGSQKSKRNKTTVYLQLLSDKKKRNWKSDHLSYSIEP